MKNILKIVFVIIGTLIGAGFASGQEIYLFFFSHGLKGIIGIFISSILMGIVIYKSLVVIKINNIKNYKEYLKVFLKIKKGNKVNYIVNILNIIITIFILITFFIMIAGFGAYFQQEIGINQLVGSSLLAIISLVILMTNIKGVVKVNEVFIPVLIITIFIIGIINLTKINFLDLKNYIIDSGKFNYIVSAVLYCSYNSILLIPVLITLNPYLESKKQISKISVITSSIIILLSVTIFLMLTKVDVDISKLEMPAVYVVSNLFRGFKALYGIIILGSIFTTSISLGISFLNNTTNNRKSYQQIAIIMCITSILVSKIGFSNLINLLYPIFGYLGLVQILANILKKT